MYCLHILRSLLIILILSYCSIIQAEGKAIEGLLFNSIYDDPKGQNKATSLTIPSKDAIFYENNLTIEFDVFFWRKSPFGFILSAGNENDPNLFVLSYSDYKSQDTSFIELTYADRPSIISIPILDKDQGWGKWKNIKLYFEIEKQRVGLSFQNQNIIWYKESIPVNNKMQFDFGSTSFVVEPPRMAIKNIYINRDDQKTILWKLDEEFGEKAYPHYENGTSWVGKVADGIWIKDLHRQLNSVLSHEVQQNNFRFLGVDDELNQFIYLINDSLLFYNYNKVRFVEKYSFPYLTEDNYIYEYNPVKKLVFATHGGGGGPISYFDQENLNWKDFVEGYESDGLFYTSEFIYDFSTHDIFTIGGYGWYEQKNLLQKYNDQNLSWDPIKYKTRGDASFYPRCKSIISIDKENKQYWLYGGQGNESGKQQQGFRELNDFWKIDLKNLEFQRIWKDSSKINDPMDKHQKIAISPKNQKIYKIIGNQISSINNSLTISSDLEILVSSFKSRDFKKYIIDIGEDQDSEIQVIDFHALDSTNELLVIYQKNNSDGNYIVFSTIKTPLIAPYEAKANNAEVIILILVGCGILIFLFTTRYEREDEENCTKKDLKLQSIIENKPTVNKGLSIKLLRNLEIVNQGINISGSYWKSKKARNLFVFIILKGESGTSLNEIHNVFWPNVSLESARNSRAVALSRIRSVIAPYDNLLVTKEETIRFEDHEDVYVDYRYFDHLVDSTSKENFQALLSLKLFDKEQLIKFSQEHWVGPYRSEILDKLSKYAKNLAGVYIHKKQWEELGFIGNKLLTWNSFHDDGMKYSVLANWMLKKNALSHKVYSDFIKNYELEIGEKYPLSYNNILSYYETE